jgi:hypothetical protein
MRTSIVLLATAGAIALAGTITLASPEARADSIAASLTPEGGREHVQVPAQGKPLMSGEHMGRIREEIHLHEQRAHEIEPIVARDRQARHDVEVDWAVLERHARELHARANDFRGYASEAAGARAQGEMNKIAGELDEFATHDEENARLQHEIADRLERGIQSENAARDWHLRMAQRLRDWIASNGG